MSTVSGFDPLNTSIGTTLSSVNSLNDTATASGAPATWSNATAYTVGQHVAYSDGLGNFRWQCIQNNTNQTPSISSAYWETANYWCSRSLGFQTSGQAYFEFTVNVGAIGTQSIAVGICSPTMKTDGTTIPGLSGDGIGNPTSISWINALTFPSAFISGTFLAPFLGVQYGFPHTCAVAIDFDRALLWISNLTNPNEAGTTYGTNIWSCANTQLSQPGNPSLAVGGFSFAPIISGPDFYAAVGFYDQLASVTINWSGNSFLPAGFQPWTLPPPVQNPVGGAGTGTGSDLGAFPPQWPAYPISPNSLPPILYD